MSNDAVITLSIKDEGTPVLAASRTKVREAVEGMAGSLRIVETASKATQAELERSFTAAQQRWAAAATQTTQAARQVETALTAEQQAARAAASAREGLVRSAIAEQQVWRQMNEVRAETANRLAVEARAVRAAGAGYDQSAGFLEKYAKTSDVATEATGRHSQGLGAITRHYGILTQSLPGASGAMGGFISVIQGGSPQIAFMAVTLGLLIQKWTELRTINREYITESEKTTIALATQRAEALATVRKLDAELLGNRLGMIRAERDTSQAAIEGERLQRLAAARQKFEADKSIFDLMSERAARERWLASEVDKINQDADVKRRMRNREASADEQRFAKETADTWAKEMLAGAQKAEALATILTRSLEDIGLARRKAGAEGAGSPSEGQGADWEKVQLDAKRARQARVEELDTMVLDQAAYRARLRQIDDEYWATLRVAQLRAGMDAQKAYEQATTGAAAMFAKLGPGFEDLAQRFTITETVQKAQPELKLLAELFKTDQVTARQAGDAVATLTQQLVDQGATMDQIGQVVPDILKGLTSLFRTQRAEVIDLDAAAAEFGTGLRSLGRDGKSAIEMMEPPVRGMIEYFTILAGEADRARLAIVAIPRGLPMTPRAGMLEPVPVGPPAAPSPEEGTPSFGRGGRVPGPIGMPQWAVVHGGETIDAAGRGGGRAVVINIDARGQDARAIAREIERLRERGALD
jgi:hypothetical protein